MPPPSTSPSFLSVYLRQVEAQRPHSACTERALARQVVRGSRAAFGQLVAGKLPFVVSLAKRRLRSGRPLMNLIAEGNVGLLHAALKFDPDARCRFTTYACWWVSRALERACEPPHGEGPDQQPIPAHLIERMLQWTQVPAPPQVDGDPGLVPEVPSSRAPSGENRRRSPGSRAAAGEVGALLGVFGMLDPRDRELLGLRFDVAGAGARSLGDIIAERRRTHELVRRLERQALDRICAQVRDGAA